MHKNRFHLRAFSVIALAGLFVTAGCFHFLKSAFYLKMMPTYLPFPFELIYITGAWELIGGLALLVRKWRRKAAWALIILLVVVFPANINMLVNSNEFASVPYFLLVLRLPLQFVLIAWIWGIRFA